MRNFVTSSWGFGTLFLKDENVEELPLIDGRLIVDIKLNLYAPKPVQTVAIRNINDAHGTEEKFKSKFNNKLILDMANLLCNHSQDSETRTKIISKDKVEFPVNRAILSGRNCYISNKKLVLT